MDLNDYINKLKDPNFGPNWVIEFAKKEIAKDHPEIPLREDTIRYDSVTQEWMVKATPEHQKIIIKYLPRK